MPKIGEIEGNLDIYSKREVLKINHLPLVVFFRKKFSRAESCAEAIPSIFFVNKIKTLFFVNYFYAI